MEFTILQVWGTGGPSAEPLHIAKEPYAKHSILHSPESRSLQRYKNEIDLFYEEGKWDDYKKITNPYEYIFLSWNRRSSRSVTTRQPLSRSYFKMIELWKRLDLDTFLKPLIDKNKGLITAHAAEGPGGFIEACTVISERNGWDYLSAFAITLRSEAKNVPGWRKAARFLSYFPQIHIHDGEDGTGNILRIENQNAYVESVRAEHIDGVHIFTADGGFDFSNDYNAQEDTVFPLFLAEVIIGLQTLQKGGCMIIKCFDTIELPTLHLLWLASRAFCEWGIVKPRTSRAGNAERYLIGKGFLGNIEDILGVLLEYQANASFTVPILGHVKEESYKSFLVQIAGIQESIEHMEIIVIKETLDLIKDTDRSVIIRLVRSNIQRSIDWCMEHGEVVSHSWRDDMETNVISEANDLLHILKPPMNTISYSYNNWNHRSTFHSQISFDGFRSTTMTLTPLKNNPFMRIKGKDAGAKIER